MSDEQRTAISDQIPLDTLFDLLSHHHRRKLLALLVENDQQLTENDLAKEIISRERDSPITDIPGEDVTQTFVSLHHQHIPKLAETQLIKYDKEREIVKPTEPLKELEPFLAQVAEADTANDLFDQD